MNLPPIPPLLTSAKDIFSVANDVRFLFKKLRRSPESQRLADSCSAEDLLKSLAANATHHPANVAELVDVYLHFSALYLKGDDAVAKITSSHIPQVQWAEEFVALMREAATPTTRIIINPNLVEHTHSHSNAGSVASTYKKLILPLE